MAAMQDPVDEIQYQFPPMIEWWVNSGFGKPMDENMIHRYFAGSPFFDSTTKNGLILLQAENDMHAYNLSWNRQALEDNLRKRAGTEYMIVGQPQPHPDPALAAQGLTTGVYTIRKQDRQRASGDVYVRPPHVLTEKDSDGKGLWGLTILGTYFLLGEAVYQAPSVFDIVGNRLLAAASSLKKFYETADCLPRYTPAIGYHYLPRSSKPAAATTSVPGTPARSREGSLAPATDSQSLRLGSVQPDAQAGTTAAAVTQQETNLLAKSLEDSIRYGDEYTDENPLLGAPGTFYFQSSNTEVRKRREKEAAGLKAHLEQTMTANAPAAVSTADDAPKAPSPPAVFTQEKVLKAEKANGERKGSKSSKKDRRKSRPATSPTTPASATSPQALSSAS
ncbi:Mediator of RNA polymerase II transcription subunit 6 [Fulvia fulva]|uniref:Mediator of RNA polymerase II transcription subunit 6 n=1 Tax=Passalora fulva TaxID=5499 RepID=A0A9Q8P5D9_PASFU|nr:Mediator of RNA polymerase II transcription subunit 6 [Fulvia fulva]KAK4631080.1 Mediator of RNA polymerase II transcription subunit 6 [Fulvia fulva]KAK4632879.1 Mediator of RNA polymerase II transcription subunit 6 [Fulvia fulva]UJO13829.1 Mediator of RNA polymerase II transcription subunit 6 [Fulvia fulva]WPV11946.1 Mediator of RNA polymerase II transcription subunit 6 [Fulvia fulva]WPV25937.1 Mediator of RNA polymerase II transcription subunit 6 [Fulvia fulva]